MPPRTALEIASVAAGMVLFAVFSHEGLPWILAGGAGLLTAAVVIAASGFSADRPAAVIGLQTFTSRIAVFCTIAAAAGIGAGLLHRGLLGLPLQLTNLKPFVVVACIIGTAEELLYRGWMFGKLRPVGWPASALLAAAAHALYKTALFVSPSIPITIALGQILFVTFVAGIVLGLLRAASGSLLPAMLAHAAFDLIVYGALSDAPWWVWH